ncbi:MAG: hypothetical protein A2046_08700 [Bacteroidetes bacterium GWA2_30_7]|nr:MAG: hypothetical protein A2046_08700 [Bacteroidetes bacterium GWA2_30_7]
MLKIGRYSFDGIFLNTNKIASMSGVYAVFSVKGKNKKLIDIGESAYVKDRLDNHNRKDCWSKECTEGNWGFAVHYTYGFHKAGRMKIEQEIRKNHNLACGIR